MVEGAPEGSGNTAWRRFLWFVALWVGGVVTITIVGYLLRAVFFIG